MTEMETARVVPYAETLAVHVERQVPEDEDYLYEVPKVLLDAFEIAHCAAFNAGEVLVAFTEGGEADVKDLPPSPHEVVFGDPRVCWNPVPHRKHRFEWSAEDVAGWSDCSGEGKEAAEMLGLAISDRAAPKDLPTPPQLIAALRAAGFTVAGGREGWYVRFRWPETRDGRDASMLVPLDSQFADYVDGIRGTVGELELVARIGRTAQAALDHLWHK